MKKLLLLLIACGLLTISFESQASLPGEHNQHQILVSCLSNQLSVKQYQNLLGRKITLSEKINYIFLKHRLKKFQQDNSGFSAGGFVLGFLLGPVGVGIAYLASKNKHFRKGAVTGFAVLVGLTILGALLIVTIIGDY